VPKNQANSFIRDILRLYSVNLDNYDMDNADNFTKEMLRQIIKAKKENKLIFVDNNVVIRIIGQINLMRIV